MSKTEEYSFNIPSKLFQQLTKEQQVLWRKEIESAFNNGYHQAKKDLELTWEDVEKIYELVIETDNEYSEANADNDYEYDVKEMYQEVLKRFKERKEMRENVEED